MDTFVWLGQTPATDFEFDIRPIMDAIRDALTNMNAAHGATAIVGVYNDWLTVIGLTAILIFGIWLVMDSFRD